MRCCFWRLRLFFLTSRVLFAQLTHLWTPLSHIISHNYKGQLCTDRRRSRAGRVEDSGGLGGRNRALRSRRRPGRQGVGRPKWSVLQNRVSSPPGQGLFREPGAVARPGSERTAPARGPAWPCWPPPRCWPWPRPRRPRPSLERHPHPRRPRRRHPRLQQRRLPREMQQHLLPLRRQLHHDSTDYTIAGLFVRSSGSFSNSASTPTITTETAALTLVVGSTSLVLADATTTNTSLEDLEQLWRLPDRRHRHHGQAHRPRHHQHRADGGQQDGDDGRGPGVRLHGGRLRLRR